MHSIAVFLSKINKSAKQGSKLRITNIYIYIVFRKCSSEKLIPKCRTNAQKVWEKIWDLISCENQIINLNLFAKQKEQIKVYQITPCYLVPSMRII